MTLLIENLAEFNRKERFHLLSYALSLQQSNICLSQGLRGNIARITGFEIRAPVFLAMDFHLDWLTAALEITRLGKHARELRFNKRECRPLFERGTPGRITGSPEDVDLLVAFPSASNGKTVLVLIEAKSETSWSTTQLVSKGERLHAIFGDDNAEWKEWVVPHLLLTSPRAPVNLDYSVLPTWARRDNPKNQWFKLPVAESAGVEDLVQVVRCTGDGSESSTDAATHWKIR